jgi:hypothetical protein
LNYKSAKNHKVAGSVDIRKNDKGISLDDESEQGPPDIPIVRSPIKVQHTGFKPVSIPQKQTTPITSGRGSPIRKTGIPLGKSPAKKMLPGAQPLPS